MTVLLECRDVSKVFKDAGEHVQVLKNLNFSIQRGEQVAILGSSGSGKSTLLHILGALDSPSQGHVSFLGEDIFALSAKQKARFRNQNLGFVYQFHHLLPEFSALENIAMPMLIAKKPKSVALESASQLLDKVGLAHRGSHRPAQLSGGERQRVAIARALVMQPDLVLADEPTGNLDEVTGEGIFSLIQELREQLNTAFVVVTHDKSLASRMDRTLVLQKGELQLS